ncbi:MULTISPECIES: aldo/keto reductase [unclassified Pseudomonas]|uniref:aldo/keto reductase n=1 Tax=unclassified Pseudomonas TaxID=196821 RepID=UPI000CD0344E|nr:MULTISPECIES: aldo/keto reductase [unclassified Pseudomonas]POA51330.1 aldo/keto reductase [Pseudomonas sp. FW507-12TSA]
MAPQACGTTVATALGARRVLGRTGLRVSPVALGTMQFGWTASDVQSMRILDAYRAAGGNLIDTANMYGGDQSTEQFAANRAHVGMSEDIIGRWLQTRGGRDDLVLTTKVRARMWEGADGEGLTRAHIMRAVEDSLRRLRTECIDVLYAHWPDPQAHPEEWLEAFGDLLTPLLDLARRGSGYPAIQVEQPRFNLLNRGEYEPALQRIALDHGLGIVTYSSLASGFLAGAVPLRQAPCGSRARFLAQYCVEEGWQLLEALQQIARDLQVPVAAVALAWTQAQPGVTSTLIGPDRLEQLAEASWSPAIRLDQEQLACLDRLSWRLSRPEFVQW